MTITIEPPRQPEVLELLRLSDEYAAGLYPPDSSYLLDLSELEAPDVTVFMSRSPGENAIANGMAALVMRGDGSSAELKRMFVLESARGRGVARSLLAAIDEYARERDIRTLQLEAGSRQPAAIALYESAGFQTIANFGQYIGDEFSLCMEKPLQ